ncbi:MAG: NAD(P)-binding domain-containing protein [Bacteroidetes bacterium]|nr:NAD(P)-binding domain-containing protein [Bacteroidota bacterium]
MNMKKIGILGSGAVAKVLATGFLKHGYEVMVGSRDVSKLAEWQQKNSNGKTGSFKDTAQFGDIIVLAVKGSVAKDVLTMIGVENVNGKTIIDATNPIDAAPPVNGVIQFFTDLKSSLLEILQTAYPGANFVKAFNSVGSAFMVNPDFGGIKPSMFICGNNETAKNEVKTILDKFGWETEDMGKAEAARAIEPLCILWCIPGFLENRWTHAFKLLKK